MSTGDIYPPSGQLFGCGCKGKSEAVTDYDERPIGPLGPDDFGGEDTPHSPAAETIREEIRQMTTNRDLEADVLTAEQVKEIHEGRSNRLGKGLIDLAWSHEKLRAERDTLQAEIRSGPYGDWPGRVREAEAERDQLRQERDAMAVIMPKDCDHAAEQVKQEASVKATCVYGHTALEHEKMGWTCAEHVSIAITKLRLDLEVDQDLLDRVNIEIYKVYGTSSAKSGLDMAERVALLCQERDQLAKEIDNLVDALETAPIHRLDETLEQFLERYKKWHREQKVPTLQGQSK